MKTGAELSLQEVRELLLVKLCEHGRAEGWTVGDDGILDAENHAVSDESVLDALVAAVIRSTISGLGDLAEQANLGQ